MARSIKLTRENLTSAMQTVQRWISEGLEGGALELSLMRPNKSRAQEKLYHRMFAEFERQAMLRGRKLESAEWKAILIEQFGVDRANMGKPLRKPAKIMPAFDGSGRFVMERPATSELSAKEASDFIEYLFATGIECGVKWPLTKDQYEAALKSWY